MFRASGCLPRRRLRLSAVPTEERLESLMGEEDWYKPNPTKAPPRQPKPGELLFESLVGEACRKRPINAVFV